MKNKKLKIVLICIISIVVIFCSAFYIYTLGYNRTNSEVFDLDGMNDTIDSRNLTVFYPSVENNLTEKTGVIFYPGGKVEASAYSPILLKLAEEGFTCVLVDMPMNLAIFNINAADKVIADLPDIENWYLMGHSLGGAMASQYAEKNYSKINGLILLGAYPINDAEVDTLVVYGSEDVGLDREKLVGVPNQYEIEGGNHSFFGNYGENRSSLKRDGKTTITRDEQQDQTIEIFMEYYGTSN